MSETASMDAVIEQLSGECALGAQAYLATMTEIGSGSAPDAAISMSLLALSQLLVTGARLGAIEDIIPQEQFEADAPEPELEPLRNALANLFEGIDEYADLVDPVTSPEVTTGSLSNDLIEIAAALDHGLRHYEAGRWTEALWWWQFSYLSHWGTRASAALRVIQTLLGHIRLDADEDSVAEAEFDALHP